MGNHHCVFFLRCYSIVVKVMAEQELLNGCFELTIENELIVIVVCRPHQSSTFEIQLGKLSFQIANQSTSN